MPWIYPEEAASPAGQGQLVQAAAHRGKKDAPPARLELAPSRMWGWHRSRWGTHVSSETMVQHPWICIGQLPDL